MTEEQQRRPDTAQGQWTGLDDVDDDRTNEMDRAILPTGELPELIRDESRPVRRIRPIRFTIKVLLLIVIVVFLLPGVLNGFRRAIDTIRDVNPILLLAGFALQLLALLAYSLLTRTTLGTAGRSLSLARIFRIQLSTKALSNIVPGGNAASSALGYRLLTLSGISGPDAGFALASAGIGSAVVLNIIFWTGLTMSIPFRGVNEGYALAALAGIIIMGLAAGLVLGVMDGSGRAESVVRWFARKMRLDEDRFAAVLHQLAERLEELVSDRQLLWRVVFWATANWLLDAASLWVFLRAYGVSLPIDALMVACGRVRGVRARGDPDPARWPRCGRSDLRDRARRLRGASPHHRPGDFHLSLRAVPDADRHRCHGICVAPGRAVEDRKARSARRPA